MRKTAKIIPFPKPCRPLPLHADPRVLRIKEILREAMPVKEENHASH